MPIFEEKPLKFRAKWPNFDRKGCILEWLETAFGHSDFHLNFWEIGAAILKVK